MAPCPETAASRSHAVKLLGLGALATAAATHFDIDHDCDLDLVIHPVNGPITFFRNNAQSGQAIRFVPQDHVGNRDGFGARVTIANDGGKVQMRENRLGGGFMSFDAPVAHFGLGPADTVEQLVIRWRDGSETVVPGPLEAGRDYVVTWGAG